jgi:ATP-dependent RNA helicase MRH4, mitochondrial
MTSAHMNRAPERRSAAAIKRDSGDKRVIGDAKDKPKTNDDTFRALKMQRALASVSYLQRNRIKEKIADRDSFDHFSLLPAVKSSIASQALAGLEEIVPTPIQRLAIPALLGPGPGRRGRSNAEKKDAMQQFLLAAETGSGKTLAYLLPTINAIKLAEAADVELEERKEALSEEQKRCDPTYVEPPPVTGGPHSTTGRPRAIILLPTAELVAQVSAAAKSLSHVVKFRSSAISASHSARVIRNRLFSPGGIDLLISTPHLLASIAEAEPYILSRVTRLVIDEADSLLDRSFAPTTSVLIDKCTPSLEQLILCSATIPRSLDTYLRGRFPDMRRLVTPNLHAVPRRVQLGVVDVEKDPFRGNKLLACADAIWSIGKAGDGFDPVAGGHATGGGPQDKRLLVFVNEREKTREVADYLRSKGIDATALNRDTPEERKSEILAEFTASSSPSRHGSAKATTDAIPIADARPKASRRSLPDTKVVVTTDLASRGIDTIAVRHVILYDVPHSTIDFIHRLGRTGRMGRRGRGIVLVGKHDRRDVVREVREGMFRGQALI